MKGSLRRNLLAFGLTFTAFSIGLVGGMSTANTATASSQNPYEGLDVFARAMTQIQQYYVEEQDNQELVHAAIDGMADSLDEQTRFFDPETYQSLREQTEGSTGIGVIVIASEEGGLLIEQVVAGSPAELAELQVGDRIVVVDGKDIRAWTMDTAVRHVKGPRGTEVILGVVRGDEELSLTVVRDEIHTPSVRSEVLDDGVAYVHIDQFRRRAGEEFMAELEAIGPQDTLILDLRHNPGGLLDEAVVVADHFLDAGLIVETRGRDDAPDERHEATADGTDTDTRLFILVDGLSASASEIVAGALQDHDRATIVGSPSYGKGSVQTYFEYEDMSALKLTIGLYTLPSGRHLKRGEGITPDVLVDLERTDDPALALVRGLEDAELPDDEKDALLELAHALPEGQGAAPRPTFRGPVDERAVTDVQLAKALELARTP